MQGLYMSAHQLNANHTLSALTGDAQARLLDLGCDDGAWSHQLARRLNTKNVYGMEVMPERARLARDRGIQTEVSDLEAKWPYENGFFDVVHSSFVIEHVCHIDHFVSETWRTLKPGGYTLMTTENGSSWHNIVAAVMGWQTFSSSCCSTKVKGLGNPLALHRGGGESPFGQTHKVIFHYLGFIELFKAYGFMDISVTGAGYYPLPAWMGRWDPRHAHFLLLKAYKPLNSARSAA